MQYMSLPPCTKVEQAAPKLAVCSRLERKAAPSIAWSGRPRLRSRYAVGWSEGRGGSRLDRAFARGAQ